MEKLKLMKHTLDLLDFEEKEVEEQKEKSQLLDF